MPNSQRTKRRLERVTTYVSLLLIVSCVATWLFLILQNRTAPMELVVLSVVGLAGAIGATYKIEDIKAVLEVVRK